MMLIRAYTTHGHMLADIDPLELYQTYRQFPSYAEKFKIPRANLTNLLDYKSYGFTEADLDREFYVDAPELAGLLSRKKNWKLGELIDSYTKAYCGKIGVEYMHIMSREQCNWIRDKFEGLQFEKVPNEQRVLNFDRLVWADEFQKFLANKFNTTKRFGLEGCESFIVGLKVSFDALVESGVSNVVIGMPHRGRMNVLGNVVRKPLEQIFNEFQGKIPGDSAESMLADAANSGDVKYHLGTTFKKSYPDGRTLTSTVLANPSHLETIDPVVLGKVRAEQHLLGDTNGDKVVPIVIHGDAAFAGQGVVYESMQMANLINYRVGGTIHVVVNNQIGFTTCPNKSRSGVYCSDLAKSVDAPIFHVNADSMDDVAKVFRIAAEYRQKFKNDVVIDLIGYRKHGHNELDQPSFTQPLMYKRVAQMKPVADKYEEQLISEGVIKPEEVAQLKGRIKAELERAYEASKDHKFKIEEWKSEEWEGIKDVSKFGKDTGLKVPHLKQIGEKITILPDDWTFHPTVKRIYETRRKSIQEGKAIDWGTAEALAFATLIDEGFQVRVSGQDVERGTFSHRHAVVFDQEKDQSYIPIHSIYPSAQIQRFQICNSHLSEYAVLGYEYGYAQTLPNTLTIWEAQFGDFANGAQIIIDTMIASGESKWNVKQGLVLLLPHGYDGQGPEHSSSRIERFLQLSDEHESQGLREERVNMQVVNASTAANYFHLLRRQMRRSFRKPLIVAAPKKLLKFHKANSDIEEFGEGNRFKKIYVDQNKSLVAPEKVMKVILCSGQVYYDIENSRVKDNRNDIAVIRVEQLSPFPFKNVSAELAKYKNASIQWVQEEPQNQGYWHYVSPKISSVLKDLRRPSEVTYAGRKISASTASGYSKVHEAELRQFLQEAMKI